ncbi:hypothetical protein BT69DRAFT_214876 [Atractiella rhizophila]|nr:hypothetical protein BT69DRAFT_214876 [Atractiella rhizophila]
MEGVSRRTLADCLYQKTCAWPAFPQQLVFLCVSIFPAIISSANLLSFARFARTGAYIQFPPFTTYCNELNAHIVQRI